jgi:hypothetical protein
MNKFIGVQSVNGKATHANKMENDRTRFNLLLGKLT